MVRRPKGTARPSVVDAAMVASRALVAIAARSLAQLDDVTLPQYRALLVLASRGACTSGELAGHLGVHASSVTRLVDRLVAKGLVVRSSTSDRREVVLSVTPRAVSLLDSVTSRRRAELDGVLRRMPAAERHAVADALAAFAEAAGEVPDDQWSIVLNPPALVDDSTRSTR